MKKVLHVSSECYPAAKAGGMGDVVGALPAYLPEHGIATSVVIPKYGTDWFGQQKFKRVYKGSFPLGDGEQEFVVETLGQNELAFPFYCIDLMGLFDRPSIYLADDGHGYKDEPRRNIAFQTAVVEWLTFSKIEFDLIHVHDHMTGLIPFFMKHCPKYDGLQSIPSVLSIHNGAYRGEFIWDEVDDLLPKYNDEDGGILDWDGKINSLATAIKCSWAVNTVSPAYMEELMQDSDTLIPLYESEKNKCIGILNGIDVELWDPSTDSYLETPLKGDWVKFKAASKKYLQKKYDLISRRPLIGFIGRFAYQKGADLFLDATETALQNNMKFNVVILGSGDKGLEERVMALANNNPRTIGAEIAYNEKLARNIYAGCDFLIMPSRFEPCGLNQMYAMRYGTVPIVTHVGGLKDTVRDISNNGEGIVIKELNKEGVIEAIEKSINLYKNKKQFLNLRKSISTLDYSWSNSAGVYAKLYSQYLK